MYKATPDWANFEEIQEAYKECRELRDRGHDYEVDHIVPLNHPYVCGLHVGHNLRVIPATENRRISNHTWPDMPDFQIELDFSQDKQLLLRV